MNKKKQLHIEFLRILRKLEPEKETEVKSRLCCGSEIIIKVRIKKKLSLMKLG